MDHQLRELRGHSFWDSFGEAPILVDLGANVGRFTQEFLALYPSARVVMVEADPYLTQILEQSFARHSAVRLYKGLIGTESHAKVPFFLSKIPEGNSVHATFSNFWVSGQTRRIEVEQLSLPDLLERSRLERVDLLKVDIEGSEWELLLRLTEAEARGIAQITVEFHDFMDPSLRPRTEACVAHLRTLGYEVRSRPTAHVRGSPYFDTLFWR